MKKLNIYLSGFALLLSACSVNDFDGNFPEDTNEDMVDVTLSLSLEDFVNGSTRAGDEGSTLEDLRNINMLVYAVRDENDQLLTQYGRGIIDDELNNAPAIDRYWKEKADNSQTIMHCDFSEPVTISLRVMRGTVFKLSLWAQSSQSLAYDFTDLTKVAIYYDNINPNEETDDAFCATSKFSIGQTDTDLNVTLTRPFSLVNVGVLNLDPDKEDYKYANMEFTGLSTGFNVVDNKALSETTDYNTFGWKSRENLSTLSVTEWETSSAGGMTPATKDYTKFGMCYVLAPEDSPVGIKVAIAKDVNGSDEKTIYEDEDLPLTHNWRTNLLFKNLKKAFGEIPALSVEDITELTITDGTWHPINMPEKVTVSIPAQSNEVILPNEYTYTAKFIKGDSDDDITEEELPVTYNSVSGKFEFEINPILLEELRAGAMIQITADYTEAFKSTYNHDSEATEPKAITSVKWANPQPTYTWNFTKPDGDNLNGYKLSQAIGDSFAHKNNVVVDKYATYKGDYDDAYGLYAQVMGGYREDITRGINFPSTGAQFESGGIERNLHFTLSSSCEIDFSLVSSTTGSGKYIIVDYAVDEYDQIKVNFQGTLPAEIYDDTVDKGKVDENGGKFGNGKGLWNIQTTSNLKRFLNYNELIKKEVEIYGEGKDTSEDKRYTKRPNSVYIYTCGGGCTISSITLSCVDYEPNQTTNQTDD